MDQPAPISLATLKRRHLEENRPLPIALERALEQDQRRGVQAFLKTVRRRRKANRAEGQRLARMLRFETPLWEQGIQYVAGVDEAGMSPLAGPVIAAAVILPPGCRIRRVDDSKKLPPPLREELAREIESKCLAFGIGRVDPKEIDAINIYQAGLLALKRAVEGLSICPEHLLVDARPVALPIAQQGIVKGDAKSLSIAAASILAKTTRDRLMTEYDTLYPGYGFTKHKGYPVKAHVEALQRLGPCEIHRWSFRHVSQAQLALQL